MADINLFIAITLITLAVIGVALIAGCALAWISDKARARRDRLENVRWIDDYDSADRRQPIRNAQYNPKDFRQR